MAKSLFDQIAIYVPTTGHVWHQTATVLSAIAIDDLHALPTYVQGSTGPAECRNEIVQRFLATDRQILVMVDDDVIPPRHMLQIVDPIDQGDAEVVGAVVPIMRYDRPFLPNIFNRVEGGYEPHVGAYQSEGLQMVDAIGTGCIAIARRVLEDHHLKHPFRPKLDKHGIWLMGEDITFCERAWARGHRVAADLNVWCEHRTELHMNSIAMAYMSLVTELTSDVESDPQPDLRDVLREDVADNEGVPAQADPL